MHKRKLRRVQRGDDPGILLCRVSSPEQVRDGRLRRQRRRTTADLHRLGCPPLRVVAGCEVSRPNGDRLHLERAVKLAKRYGTHIVVEHRNRLLRHRYFDPDAIDSTEKPDENDWRLIDRILDGVEVRVLRRKPFKGGNRRPGHKKRQQARLRPRVQKLRKRGWGYGKIAARLGLSRSTVKLWSAGVQNLD